MTPIQVDGFQQTHCAALIDDGLKGLNHAGDITFRRLPGKHTYATCNAHAGLSLDEPEGVTGGCEGGWRRKTQVPCPLARTSN